MVKNNYKVKFCNKITLHLYVINRKKLNNSIYCMNIEGFAFFFYRDNVSQNQL